MKTSNLAGKPALMGIIGVLSLVAVASFVFARELSADGGDSNSIHVCVNNNSGSIQVVGSDDDCGNNETSVHWSSWQTYFAALDGDGGVGASSVDVTVVGQHFDGVTRLRFPASIIGCAVTATLGNPVPDSVSGEDIADEFNVGFVAAGIHSPSGEVSVVTYNYDQAAEDMPSYVVVACP